jgi:putative Holliday junction resolvase
VTIGPNTQRQRLLGLDVGERRIGVAVSEGSIAVPLTIITHTNRAADIDRIRALAAERDVAAIVVGLPLDIDGGDTHQSRLTRRFAADLAKATPLPVLFQDERLSTQDVPRAASKGRRREHVDDRAAAVILQRHIDEQGGRS